jgi:probable HAF family extracellular repeat protein
MLRYLTAGLAIFVLISTLLLPIPLPAQNSGKGPSRYTVMDLGTLGGSFSVASGISEDGVIAGFSTLPGDVGVHAFIWRKGVMTDLGALGVFTVTGLNAPINDRNQITGSFDTGTPDPNGEDFCAFSIGAAGTFDICLPFIWQDGRLLTLPTLGGNNAGAYQVNNRGAIAGVAETPNPDPICSPVYLQIEAVIWQHGKVQELPPLPGDPVGNAIAINDDGDAVGVTGCAAGNLHAVLWRQGMPLDLGNLGGVTGNIAFAINNRGQIVGQSDLPGDAIHHAFLWQNSVMTDLGSLPGLPTSLANGINNRGQVVGFSEDANADEFPAGTWIWQNGVMTDLNTLVTGNGSGFFLHEALGINDRGQIVGHMVILSTGELHAFLATPVEGSESPAPAAQARSSEPPKAVLPEKIRQVLRHQNRWRGLEK